MKAPKRNSNALSTREANGLSEGNGMVGESRMEDDLLFIFVCDAAYARSDSATANSLSRGGAMKMLRARADADKAGGNLSQNREPFQQANYEGQ